jgi:CRISPR-associated protein Cas2
MKLKTELNKHIRKDKDSVLVFKSRDERWLEKHYLGLIDEKTSNFF